MLHKPSSVAASPQNLLLCALPPEDFSRLAPYLERVTLVPRRVIQHAKVPVEHLYFIEEGLVSVQASTDEDSAVEVWLIGREGIAGSPAVLGVSASPLRHVVRVGGSAYRIAAKDLSAAIADIPALRSMLLSYLHVALMQSSQSAACGLRHPFPQRLARWLLTAQDRTGSDEVPVTQDLLARALGVRRATVSEAIKTFERKGVLARLRGLIRIRDRARLEKITCRCYEIMRREQERPLQKQVNGIRLFALPVFWCLLAEA
jgi:CRP-like cAMP-binding protein